VPGALRARIAAPSVPTAQAVTCGGTGSVGVTGGGAASGGVTGGGADSGGVTGGGFEDLPGVLRARIGASSIPTAQAFPLGHRGNLDRGSGKCSGRWAFKLSVGSGIEHMVPNPVRPIRAVRLKNPTDRLAECPTGLRSLSK